MIIRKSELKNLIRNLIKESSDNTKTPESLSLIAPGSEDESIADFINRLDAAGEEKKVVTKKLVNLTDDFLKTLPSTLNQVSLTQTSLGEEKVYTYDALGYVYDDGKSTIKDTVTQSASILDFLYQSVVASNSYKSKIIEKEDIKVAIKVPIQNIGTFNNLTLPFSFIDDGDDNYIEEAEGEIYINNSGGSYVYNTDIINNSGKSKIMLISPNKLPDDIDIEYSSTRKAAADSTDIASVDYIIEMLGLAGMVPGLGEPADIAAGYLALMKDPPDYIIASLCFICAVPFIGTAFGLSKLIKGSSYTSTKEASKALGETLEESGIILRQEDIKTVLTETDRIFDVLLERLPQQEEARFRMKIQETRSVTEEIVRGIRVEGNISKSNMSKFIKQTVQENIERIITDGDFRRSLKSFASDHLDEVSRIAQEALEKPESFNMLAQSPYSMMVMASDALKGVKFKMPDPPGGEVVFENSTQFISSVEDMGVNPMDKNVQKAFQETINDLRLKSFQRIKPENLDAVVDHVVQSFRDKLKIIISEGDTLPDYLDSTKSTNMLGSFTGSTGEIRIAYNPSEAADNPNYEKEVLHTIRHEMEHAADSFILTSIALGDKIAESFIQSSFLSKYGSSVKIKNKFKLFGEIDLNIENLLDKIDAGEGASLLDRKKAVYQQYEVDENIESYYQFIDDELYPALMKSDKVSPLEADVLYTSFRSNGVNKETFENVLYHLTPAEIYTRMLRMQNHAASNGFDISDTDELTIYLSDIEIFKDLIANNRDISGSQLFKHMFKIFDPDPIVVSTKQSRERVIDLIHSILGYK